ncbi:Protein CBG09158 [Caenorhabditis briggsae]|uniref:Uncharacterized protein n=2 Tax=Caenorhabditis briggsae TaxID=6238 RepID=A0AAE9DES7_CAEBR|nr:Protein CBG09158 [Caenorhabditis briggsae]ULU02749.1 hypothetical protein L3Y34_002384 [Caenorhabditis briggsae]CAP28838.1 Protein CBG09158 [Caenorhabditis briggsae]
MILNNKIVHFFIFAALVTVTSAQLRCYYGISTQNANETVDYSSANKMITSISCPGSFCMRNYQKHRNSQSNSYGCANNACTSSGCTEDTNGRGSCCCRGDFCNSGYFKTTVSSMILTIASMYFSMYMHF